MIDMILYDIAEDASANGLCVCVCLCGCSERYQLVEQEREKAQILASGIV